MPRPTPIADQIKAIQRRRANKGSGALPNDSTPRVVGSRLQRTTQPKRNRNREPLIPGGMTTRGEYNRSERAAENAQFRPEEQQINDAASAIPSWYQDYLAKLQGLQTQTVEQYQGLQKQAASLETPIDQATMVGGTSPEAVAANNARANIIKAIQGSLIQQQGAQTNKLGQYGAIATAQKTKKEEDVTKARKEVAQKRGEFRSKYLTDFKQQEFENTLLAKQFGLKQLETKSKLNQKSETTYEKEFSKQAAKFGYSPQDWRNLGAKGRAKAIADDQRRSGSKPESLARIQKKEEIKIAAKNGYTVKEWNKLSSAQRAAIVRGERGKGRGDKAKEGGTELSFRTDEQRGNASSGAQKAGEIARRLRSGEGINGVNKSGHKRSRSEAAKIILADPKAPEPVVVSAALDGQYIGFISRDTARRLHSAGLKVDEIARALGVPTYTEWRKTHGSKYKGPR